MRRIITTATFGTLFLMLGTGKSIAQTAGYAGNPYLYKPGNAGVMGIGPGGRDAYNPQYYSGPGYYGHGISGGYGWGMYNGFGYGSGYYYPNVTGMPSLPEAAPDESYLQRSSPRPRTTVAAAPMNPNTAAIDVKVPPGSQLSFQGQQTQQRGEVRFFESPPLQPGKTFAYKVKAVWTDGNGEKVERKRTIQVHAGDYVRLDLQRE